MRHFLIPGLLLGFVTGLSALDSPRLSAPDEIALLKDAMKNNHQDTEHWAFTETTRIEASKEAPKGETIVRFDPSQPYAAQFTPLLVEGKPPPEKQLKKYREQGEKRGKKIAKAAQAAALRPAGDPPSLKIGGDKVKLDVDHAQVAQEEPDRLTFEIPLISPDIPVEKLQVQMLVNKTTRLVETVHFHIREPFRVKLVAKVKAGEARLDFTVVDPKFAPVIASMKGNIGVSVLFIPINATFTNLRTEFRRVKAYDERFTVRLAPMQLLDF
jgi:hypothetical protein